MITILSDTFLTIFVILKEQVMLVCAAFDKGAILNERIIYI